MRVLLLVVAVFFALAGCSNDADIISENISTAADNFQINRRIVFYNGITGEYMLSIEGLCSLGKGETTNSVTVTCRTNQNTYKKHFLGLSDNVTFFAEQIESANADPFHYKVIFKPAAIIPDIDLKN